MLPPHSKQKNSTIRDAENANSGSNLKALQRSQALKNQSMVMFTQQSASQTSQLQFSLDCSRNPPMSSAEGSGSMQTQTAFTRCIIEPYFIEQTIMPEDAQHVRNNSLLTHNNPWAHNTYDKIKQTTQLSTMCKPNDYKASLPHCYSNKYPQKTLFLTSSQRCNGVQLCFPWAFCNECPGRGRPCQATSLLLCTVM